MYSSSYTSFSKDPLCIASCKQCTFTGSFYCLVFVPFPFIHFLSYPKGALTLDMQNNQQGLVYSKSKRQNGQRTNLELKRNCSPGPL